MDAATGRPTERLWSGEMLLENQASMMQLKGKMPIPQRNMAKYPAALFGVASAIEYPMRTGIGTMNRKMARFPVRSDQYATVATDIVARM